MATTMSQLTEYNFRKLIRQSHETREANQNALKYIIVLAASTRTNISRWDIQKIFGTKTNHFVHDKNEINKRFFEAKANAPEQSESELLQTATDRLMLAVKTNLAREIAKREHETSRCKERINLYQKTINEEIRKMTAHQAVIESLKGFNGERVSEQLKRVEESGFFTLLYASESRLTWETVNPIVLRYHVPSAGIDTTVDFGKLKAVIDLSDMEFTVTSDGPFKKLYSYCHPHVSANGNICFGDAQVRASEHLSKYEFAEFLELLAQLLSTYSPTNPYVTLTRFSEWKAAIDQRETEEVEEEEDDL